VLRGRSAEWFNDDNHYRAAIDEALDLKSAALQTFEYYVRTESTSAKVMNMDLRKAANAYRKHLEQLMRENSGAARKDLALQLLKWLYTDLRPPEVVQADALIAPGPSLRVQPPARGLLWAIGSVRNARHLRRNLLCDKSGSML